MTETMTKLFTSIDEKDTDAFTAFLADDVSFRFGNAECVVGKDNVGGAVGGFFQSIKGLKHSLEEVIESGDTVVCHGHVTYTRHDDSTLKVPFANVFKLEANKIKEYLIFVDVSTLYQ